ncbi:hypothetical protein ASF32_00670 [Methylobacterium sp. Leaf91]|nr:hypothetical protein ASF24_09285 [Methylobacterium sp. Leaf86]KQP00438.1 hypothetical protein ASF32_00670 [Methylobacterium sp. Leaf91]
MTCRRFQAAEAATLVAKPAQGLFDRVFQRMLVPEQIIPADHLILRRPLLEQRASKELSSRLPIPGSLLRGRYAAPQDEVKL